MATGERFTALELKNCLVDSLLANIKAKFNFVFKMNVAEAKERSAVVAVMQKQLAEMREQLDVLASNESTVTELFAAVGDIKNEVNRNSQPVTGNATRNS